MITRAEGTYHQRRFQVCLGKSPPLEQETVTNHAATASRTSCLIPCSSPKAADQTWRVRHDKVNDGTITLRYAGKLRRLGIGKAHSHKTVLILTNGPHTMTIDRKTGETIAEHTINPDKDYQPKTAHRILVGSWDGD